MSLNLYTQTHALFLSLAAALLLMPGVIQIASAQATPAPTQVYITMHSSPIDDYCAPCITSEKMLKEAQLSYRKILEPLGPWPWFKFTDARGNQSTVNGGLMSEDVERAKKGELPRSR